VLRVKPFPDIFLAAASALGVLPSECLVVEDAEKGIVAAHAAGMRSVAIPNEHTRSNDFSKATAVIADLKALTVELVRELGCSPLPGSVPAHTPVVPGSAG